MFSISRRSALAAILAMPTITGMSFASASATRQGEATPEAGGDTVERGLTSVSGFESSELDFQMMRSLGAGIYGGGTPGELFHARAAIGEDAMLWAPAFDAIAESAFDEGTSAEAAGFNISAREGYLRASSYWRASEYFSDPYLPERLTRGLASRDTFQKAMALVQHTVEAVEIPYEGTTLPGYFMTPSSDSNGITLLVLTGFDGTNEELWFQTALAGLDRGFNVFVAAGPGQVSAMRDNPDLVFESAYEKPIGAMLDVLLNRPEVDPEKVAIYGISFGGYFAIRGAASDSRIKALIVNSPIPNLRDYMLGFMGLGNEDEDDQSDSVDVTLEEIDDIPEEYMSSEQKLSLKAAFHRFGVDSLSGWVEALMEYDATDMLENITAPSLAMVGEGEGTTALEQNRLFVSGVSGAVTERLFLQKEGADAHCQLGNLSLSNAVLYGWLANTFAAT